MAEEKKTSTKADAKSEKTAKAAKSKDKKKSKKNPFKSIASFFKNGTQRQFKIHRQG